MKRLQARLGEISDLEQVLSLLHWDQNTMMPAGGGRARAAQLATLARVRHERLTAAETGELIAAAEAELGELAEDGVERRTVAEARRLYDKEARIPAELAEQMARAASEGYQLWVGARAENDFRAYAPALERNIELAREYAGCFDGYADPYDVLLDDYAPGMTSVQVGALFADLRGELVPLIDTLAGRELDTAVLSARYPEAGQRALVAKVLSWQGFEGRAWRLDDTVHPFATGISVADVRLTTRYEPDYFPTALYGAMHECGHGLYHAGIAPGLERTPLGAIRSYAFNESQSRLWENLVGRSLSFCRALAPELERCSQGSLAGLDPMALFRAVNAVRRSLIRIEADETTYGLHVILRYELERLLLHGELAVAQLPEAWNLRMREYLGVEVPRDADGVMQDVHWSAGSIGYFPSYAIGNLIAAQLWERIRADLPELDEQLARHELVPLRDWLREHIYRHGSRLSDDELLTRITGEPLSVAPFMRYLRAKLSDVYQLDLA